MYNCIPFIPITKKDFCISQIPISFWDSPIYAFVWPSFSVGNCVSMLKNVLALFLKSLCKSYLDRFFFVFIQILHYSIDFPLLFFVKSINFINLQVTFTKTGYTIIDYKVMKIPGAKNLRNCPYFQKW